MSSGSSFSPGSPSPYHAQTPPAVSHSSISLFDDYRQAHTGITETTTDAALRPAPPSVILTLSYRKGAQGSNA
jgi:hypothetical protein